MASPQILKMVYEHKHKYMNLRLEAIVLNTGNEITACACNLFLIWVLISMGFTSTVYLPNGVKMLAVSNLMLIFRQEKNLMTSANCTFSYNFLCFYFSTLLNFPPLHAYGEGCSNFPTLYSAFFFFSFFAFANFFSS